MYTHIHSRSHTHTLQQTKQIDSLVEDDTKEKKRANQNKKIVFVILSFVREKKRYICRSIATTTKTAITKKTLKDEEKNHAVI